MAESLTSEATSPASRSVRSNYFAKHWRGDFTLSVSWWGNGVLLGLIFRIIYGGTYYATTYLDLRLAAVIIMACLALTIVFKIWQATGIWRSAEKHKSRGGTPALGIAARVVLVLVALSSLTKFRENTVLQLAEYATILSGDKAMPEFEIVALPGGKEIEIRGGLPAGSAGEFKKVLKANPYATVVRVESVGGRMHEALNMARLIRARGMSTYTEEGCQSAATLVFISGKERTAARGAKIGFHRGNLPGTTTEQERRMNSGVASAMRRGGIAESFTKQVLAVPNDDMWYPTTEELLRAGVLTSR